MAVKKPHIHIVRFTPQIDKGTGSFLYAGDKLLGFNLELSWNKNKRNISCIPEGRYDANWEYNQGFKCDIVRLHNVPERSGILIHPANYLHELRGCIAPCTRFDMSEKTYKGEASRPILQQLYYTTEGDKNKNLVVHVSSVKLP